MLKKAKILFADGKLCSFKQMISQPTGYSHIGSGNLIGYNYTHCIAHFTLINGSFTSLLNKSEYT